MIRELLNRWRAAMEAYIRRAAERAEAETPAAEARALELEEFKRRLADRRKRRAMLEGGE